MRYLIKFSYDGSNYSGFQKQEGLNTIQEALEKAVSKVNNKYTKIVATGRTDKGVHALAQYAHADIEVSINEKKLKRALNSNLPDDIHVIETKIVPNTFHARYNIKRKKYKYIINLGEFNPLERKYVFQYNYNLDIDAMKKGIKYFEGKHDFRAFVTENKDKTNCIRTIFKTSLENLDDKIILQFEGDGFLRYQIRNMVGYLIKVGEGKATADSIQSVISSCDRTKAGKTAPAEGLYLCDVEYTDSF